MSLFTYLHIHTHFSLGGGPASPEKWCRRATELGYKNMGIADRAPISGFPRFEAAARKEGLTPLFGMEVDLLLPGGKGSAPVQPVLLFASEQVGLSNLARVSTLAHVRWPGVEASVAWEALAPLANGLVIILLGGDEAGAYSPVMGLAPKKRNEVGSLVRAVFAERAFLGVPHSGRPGDGAIAGQVVRMAGEMGLPPAALPTARYIETGDAPSYEALRMARLKAGWPREGSVESVSTQSTGSTAPDRPGPHFLRPPDEAVAMFAEWPEALDNVNRIVELCSGASRLPRGTNYVQKEDTVSLAQLAERKLLEITGASELTSDLKERLQTEVTACEQGGRVGSWLALASLGEAASRGVQGENRIGVTPVPLGAVLGMADGSLLAYAFGLSSLDPSGYEPPRRLANASQRSPLPGVEVPAGKRESLVAALAREYGTNRVAFAACGTDITPNAALSAAAAVLGLSKGDIQGSGATSWEGVRESLSNEPDEKLDAVASLACSLEGAPVSFRPDYDTLIVAPRSVFSSCVIGDWLPLLSHDAGATWVPWCEEALCELQYPALTIQSSHALSTLDAALSLARRYPTSGLSVESIDLAGYPEVTEQITQVITDGQLSGLIPYVDHEVMKGPQGEITPESVALLVARSLGGGVSPGKEGIVAWEDATGDTGGLLVYRDQFDRILSWVAGPEPSAVDSVRAALRERDDAARLRFLDTCQATGLDSDSAETVWSALAGASSPFIYRSVAHARGRIVLWSAVVGALHPAALIAGALDTAWVRGALNQISDLADKAQKLGISLLPPDVNRATSGFGLERDGTGWSIRWGLARLSGWDEGAAERLIGKRPAGGFSSIDELVEQSTRLGITHKQIETLIRAGGCDHLGGNAHSRSNLIEALSDLVERGRNRQPDPTDLFSMALAEPGEDTASRGNPTPRERYLQRSWELMHLGIGFTQAPEIDNLRRAIESSGDLKARLLSTTQIGPGHIGQSVSLVGLLTSLSFITGEASTSVRESRQGNNNEGSTDPNTMSVAWVEDMEGCIELIALPPNYERHRDQWIENSLVIVTARVGTHENGDIYLLCEQIAPFYADTVEEGFSIKVKVPARGVLRKGADKSGGAGPTSDGDVVAASVAPQTAPLRPANAAQPPVQQAPSPVTTEGSSSPTYNLIITLPDADNDNAVIDGMNALKRLLVRHPGNDAVTLRIPYSPETGSVTSAQLPYGVKYDQDLELAITRLFGPAALAVIQLASR